MLQNPHPAPGEPKKKRDIGQVLKDSENQNAKKKRKLKKTPSRDTVDMALARRYPKYSVYDTHVVEDEEKKTMEDYTYLQLKKKQAGEGTLGPNFYAWLE